MKKTAYKLSPQKEKTARDEDFVSETQDVLALFELLIEADKESKNENQ